MADLKKRIQGQSIVEIALFGSIILSILAVMLQYGLRYNFQQRAMMRSFRRALSASGRIDEEVDAGGVGSYSHLRDQHIPDPGGVMGIGSVAPFSSASSVIRSYMMLETPDEQNELPVTYMNINDDTYTFKTANFRVEDIAKRIYNRYIVVYGDLNIKNPETNGEPFQDEEIFDPDTGETEIVVLPPDTVEAVRIMDYCEGDLMSYDGCRRQCLMLVDTQLCTRECERGPDESRFKPSPVCVEWTQGEEEPLCIKWEVPENAPEEDCGSVCSETLPPENVPWYCQDYSRFPNPPESLYAYGYNFPVLEDIFSFAVNKPKSLGIQPDYTQRMTKRENLGKQESGGVITTTDEINWSETTDRTVVYMEDGARHTDGVSTTLGESVTQTCADGVCN
jgi:hypothetical protein